MIPEIEQWFGTNLGWHWQYPLVPEQECNELAYFNAISRWVGIVLVVYEQSPFDSPWENVPDDPPSATVTKDMFTHDIAFILGEQAAWWHPPRMPAVIRYMAGGQPIWSRDLSRLMRGIRRSLLRQRPDLQQIVDEAKKLDLDENSDDKEMDDRWHNAVIRWGALFGPTIKIEPIAPEDLT